MNEPAFPCDLEPCTTKHQGMSLRDYFAAKAMQGIVASPNTSIRLSDDNIAKDAYKIADAMLKAMDA